ncbi:hypothetical protein DFH06DRAFT_983127 [Mycena polygramma]|nr:hypothetical protein DFH06DRAFT_983127 [Mycena polygramma]
MRNARVMRDVKARDGVLRNEVSRRAYLYVARNTTLPPQVRHQAQLQLNTFDKYTRPTTVKNRCAETGRGRGIMSEFALCRFQFRLRALAGDLNGVKKACCTLVSLPDVLHETYDEYRVIHKIQDFAKPIRSLK